MKGTRLIKAGLFVAGLNRKSLYLSCTCGLLGFDQLFHLVLDGSGMTDGDAIVLHELSESVSVIDGHALPGRVEASHLCGDVVVGVGSAVEGDGVTSLDAAAELGYAIGFGTGCEDAELSIHTLASGPTAGGQNLAEVVQVGDGVVEVGEVPLGNIDIGEAICHDEKTCSFHAPFVGAEAFGAVVSFFHLEQYYHREACV